MNNLWDNPGARPQRDRIGRGPGSGYGKTAGKGHKGQIARSGNTRPGFEGGQSSMTLRFPKYGFRKNRFNQAETLTQLNLGKLAYHIDKGHLDTSKTITQKDLLEAGAISKVGDGVKLLSKGYQRFEALN
jgi:large subunit ribosomal protein L15